MRPVDRELLRLAVPALGALLAEPLYVLADTAVVGHLGTTELGGLAVASAALLFGYGLCIFLSENRHISLKFDCLRIQNQLFPVRSYIVEDCHLIIAYYHKTLLLERVQPAHEYMSS